MGLRLEPSPGVIRVSRTNPSYDLRPEHLCFCAYCGPVRVRISPAGREARRADFSVDHLFSLWLSPLRTSWASPVLEFSPARSAPRRLDPPTTIAYQGSRSGATSELASALAPPPAPAPVHSNAPLPTDGSHVVLS